MRILLLSTAHNSLSQRTFAELSSRGHDVYVQVASNDIIMEEAVNLHNPDLIIAPFLKKYIPKKIWSEYTTIIVHPGIKGDHGPSSIDWAILNNEEKCGVTLLQANEQLDGGDIWSSNNFKVESKKSKSYVYRHQTCDVAIKFILESVKNFESDNFTPEALDYNNPAVKGKEHNPIKQFDRAIDWSESTDIIARKIRSADSQPGLLDIIYGEKYYLYGAHEEGTLKGNTREIIAKRNEAICRATEDGAVWITHLKRKTNDGKVYFKLPAISVLGDKLEGIREVSLDETINADTFKDIWYEEKNRVGCLYFDFYNGAMSTKQCIRLKEAFIESKKRNTNVIVLMGGSDFWSNGIHLNVIEDAKSPADESWENINAIDDLIKEIILTDSHITISAMRGNAAAGGVILALASDEVAGQDTIVLNPHYKKMNLYGSEYWTYLLPKRVGIKKL